MDVHEDPSVHEYDNEQSAPKVESNHSHTSLGDLWSDLDQSITHQHSSRVLRLEERLTTPVVSSSIREIIRTGRPASPASPKSSYPGPPGSHVRASLCNKVALRNFPHV
ncbi:hypothetical protein M8818_004801 [Zalaria obscura]|uniref:Uncharacterized protein n=1 Tax=Zalaria obscura TaxID=2024903 RepID=A0ACC3SBG4_9PEZI